MEIITLRELPGIAELEQRLDNQHRLMRDELDRLETDLRLKSIELLGIDREETFYGQSPHSYEKFSFDEWEAHFHFLDCEWEEEDDFWNACGLDLKDELGDYLYCYYEFGRQLVCAVRSLHPNAFIRFRPNTPKTDAQLDLEAEAWGRMLLAKKNS